MIIEYNKRGRDYCPSLFFFMKAVDGFEPTIKLLQSRALPLGYTAITIILYIIGLEKSTQSYW